MKKFKTRDLNILFSIQNNVPLKTKTVKSKKVYNRKKIKASGIESFDEGEKLKNLHRSFYASLAFVAIS